MVQAALKEGRFELKKIAGAVNPANALRKPLGKAGFEEDLLRVGACPIRREQQ